MGKASRHKRERKAVDHLKRLRDGMCTHCGTNPRHGTSMWCRACATKGARVANAKGLEVYRATQRGEHPHDTSCYGAVLEWLEAHPEP